MTDAQIKFNLIKSLQETLEKAKRIVDGIDSIDRLNDYDLIDQTVCMDQTLDKVIATAHKSLFINGYMADPEV